MVLAASALSLQAVVKTVPLDHSSKQAVFFAMREALVLSRLPAHKSTVQLLDVVRTQRSIHLVMDIAQGHELFSYVNSRPAGKMDETEARRMTASLLEALRHIHENGVQHRDIKLDNIFWDPETGVATILDFGLSTFFDDRTMFDEAVGCINYASPSLLELTNNGTPYLANHGHGDLWALGVLVHGAITGFFPFRSENAQHLAREIGTTGVDLPLDGVSECARDFVRILLDPRNEGRMDANLLLQHPWVAPFATKSSTHGDLYKRPTIPFMPSAIISPAAAAKAVKAQLVAALPEVLEKAAARVMADCKELEGDGSDSDETACEDEAEEAKLASKARRNSIMTIRAAQMAAWA